TQVAEFARLHPEAVEAHPDAWFTIALERWEADDVTAARHWMERILEREPSQSDDPHTVNADHLRQACIRLMRARIGLEPTSEAIDVAKRAVARAQRLTNTGAADVGVLPVLMRELGVIQNWIGDLEGAEASLTTSLS